jgi:hypothetical protein
MTVLHIEGRLRRGETSDIEVTLERKSSARFESEQG